MFCHLFMKVCTCHRLQATCHVIHLLARQVIACVKTTSKRSQNNMCICQIYGVYLLSVRHHFRMPWEWAWFYCQPLHIHKLRSDWRFGNLAILWCYICEAITLVGPWCHLSIIYVLYFCNFLLFLILIQIAAGSPRSSMATSPQPPRYAIEKEQTDSQLRKLELENSSLKLENKSLKDKYNRAQCK